MERRNNLNLSNSDHLLLAAFSSIHCRFQHSFKNPVQLLFQSMHLFNAIFFQLTIVAKIASYASAASTPNTPSSSCPRSSPTFTKQQCCPWYAIQELLRTDTCECLSVVESVSYQKCQIRRRVLVRALSIPAFKDI